MHRAIAARLREAPELVGIARGNLERWSKSAGRSEAYLEGWRTLLELPLEELLALLQEDSETMRAMRQSSPFAGVLSPQARWEIYDSFAVGTRDSGSGNDR
jgi:hypothetical protein